MEVLTDEEFEKYDGAVSQNADNLILKGYKQWRKERKQPKRVRRYVSQEDRLREIEEDILLEQRKT